MSESPALLDRVEARRLEIQSGLDPQTQARLGQHLTNAHTAEFMAGMLRLPSTGTYRLLDPGAGSGALTAAVVARVLAEAPDLHLDATVVEADSAMLPALRETVTECERAAVDAGVEFTATVIEGSYIETAEGFDLFDAVIQNPPYAKLPAKSPDRLATARQTVDCPNIYAAFVALSVAALRPGGQLVAITPRSFTNGTYFAKFRQWLLPQTAFDTIHIFDSRNSVFADSGVLQETIIYSMTRTDQPLATTTLSVSRDHRDAVTRREVDYTEIIHPGDRQLYVRIPSSPEDADLVAQMSALPCSLSDLGIRVSTGRVVDFRSRDQLLAVPYDEHYPMVYPANISHGFLTHPKETGKPQWFSVTCAEDRRWLVPEGIYPLVKRFSAKEETRRLVASVWNPAEQRGGPVAFDNKLNYFHVNRKGLDADLAMGLAVWLNSEPVDRYFRTFSGHTQVNATDLRGMRWPTATVLRDLGAGRTELPDTSTIDRLVAAVIAAEQETAA
ncbi:Eco57I restriction-modification methylase domain-containing protein [Gordonia sp. (in: high G+C Gram-positive bacteria)]|uniref:Eco57I restriction-modification methylase domain-containing protein n=1 Tax=Gordonia sp. (in: high G+C Gram-positive bacteria) TaxID=84139 RepID=UPI0035292BBA